MRNLIFTMTAALALAGCGDSPPASGHATQASERSPQAATGATAIKIADINFLNMGETHDIAKKLAPADAALFLEYAINWKAAKVSGDESKILKPDGIAPVTIADAIALTKAVLAKNAEAAGR
ncbi:MAG: hypothetical protein M0R03_14360 [Novosphingobium sp.]|nr:hypothetical protein [Novosphingobium sp.]